MEHFGKRLLRAFDAYGHLCVGIDPHPGLLTAWGLPDSAVGVREFSLRVIEAAQGRVPAVKPQSAFFEKYGSAGIAVLEEVLGSARDSGLLSVLDVKRGDIGSTMEGYAQAYLSESSPLRADAITLSPYLGVGALEPAFKLAGETGRGIFTLALTSNPQGKSIQRAETSSGVAVARAILEEIATQNAAFCDESHIGPFGAVVGATIGASAAEAGIDFEGVKGAFLVPGIGAQGAGPTQVNAIFKGTKRFVLASASRSILGEGPQISDLQKAIDNTSQMIQIAVESRI